MLNRIVAKMKTVSGSTDAWPTVNTSSYFMSVQISVLCILNFYFVCVCVYATEWEWRPEDSMSELLLSFHHVGPRVKVRSSGLEAGAFTS